MTRNRTVREYRSAVQEPENAHMQIARQVSMQMLFHSTTIFVRLALSGLTLTFLLIPSAPLAQQGNEKTFATPGNATLALYNAVKSSDSQAIAAIFGSNANEILPTGDAVADKKMGEDFIRRYEQMHRVVIEPDQTVALYVCAANWPLPISIVKNSSNAWYFDSESGKQEILRRRVGTNENDAIDVLHNLVGAQQD
jgi:hypothetical protein